MIEIEDLSESFREWECSSFEHLASQREENRISVPVTLGQSGSIRSTEMVEAKNLDLVPDVTDFQDVSGRKTAFHLLSAGHAPKQSNHGDDRGRKPRSRC